MINSNEIKVHLTIAKSDFECPICTCINDADVWEDKYMKSKDGFIKVNCKGCKRKLNFCLDMTCTPVVWEWVKGSRNNL